ncbi:MAG TPA: B12-binding domain-containing radical SAM protein [Bacteroidetes bacterium]|nr:B12-binding domain-containing radical SAM protein [Bacteroidota bacterium]
MKKKRKNKKKVLLIYPSSEPFNPGSDREFENLNNVPIGILSIATSVSLKYPVQIIDCRLYSKEECMSKISAELDNSFCVGVSLTTPQVAHGLQLIDFIKSKKGIPLVVGGIHATLFPEETCKEKNIDFVIYGEGEIAFLELLNSLDNGKTYEKIENLVFKKGRKIIKNPQREPVDVESLPPMNYALLDIKRYTERAFYTNIGLYKKFRGLDISTSRGCPYQCTFCINNLPYLKKWRARSVEEVTKEIDILIKKYSLNHLWIMDDFFFADKQRAEKIIRHLIKINYKGTWEANIRANLFSPSLINDEFLKLAKKSGCLCLRMGMESGSDRMLKVINKGITSEQIINAVRMCEKHKIIPLGTFICAVPGEKKEDLFLTAQLIQKIKKISPLSVLYIPGILRPYPGSKLYEECKKLGFKEPQTLREWASKKLDFESYVNIKDLVWVENANFILNFQVYLFLLVKILTYENLGIKKPISLLILSLFLKFRFKHNLWSFCVLPKLALFVNEQVKKNVVLSKFFKNFF